MSDAREIDQTDDRKKARTLYQQGWKAADIARELQIKPATVRSWKRREGWASFSTLTRIEGFTEDRLSTLTQKENKTPHDFKEIDLLWRQLERAARIRRFETGGTETDLNPKLANRNKGPKKQPTKNEISEEQASELKAAFFSSLFTYQKGWWTAGLEHRTRFILKSRQIGATWYFAREALIDATLTGRNQIFLSASKAQAKVFRNYIVAFASTVGVKLQGDPIVLPNGAELIFVSTNARTAQSYHGNLYVDEVFWIPKFQELKKTAGAMASQKQWRTTYFSTPSSLTHEAYPYWTGGLYNRGRPKDEQVEINISHAALKSGSLCADGIWRQIVTIEDALESGCDLFDLVQLRLETSVLEFAQLYLSEFIDEENAVFGFQIMQKCMIDSLSLWKDFAPDTARPLGTRPVWIGYDPAVSGDAAGLVVIAPPLTEKGPFRILEKYQWRGMDFAVQAAKIKDLTKKYAVEYIGIDKTGVGAGVYQTVQQFFPRVRGFFYSPEVKNALVLKAYDVIAHQRLQFDAGWTDVAAAFMAIRKSLTASGKAPTYSVGRSAEISHADLAWATMHALANEPLSGQPEGSRQSILEFS